MMVDYPHDSGRSQIPPFNLPEPMLWLDDSWDDNSLDATKKMGVWKISDLQSHV